jgi:hypothetical protein|tara:strand:+ start:2551 stop:3210 length:660 start_codon:yes stop_codon:yes gene_type:complete
MPDFRNIEVNESDNGVDVNFYPDLFVAPILRNKPSEENPDVLIDFGRVGGKVVPISAHYPEGYTGEKVAEESPALFEKIVGCPSCERKRREILKRLKDAVDRGGTPEERKELLQGEVSKLRDEFDVPEEPSVVEEPISPPVLVPDVEPVQEVAVEEVVAPVEQLVEKPPLAIRMRDNVYGAQNEMNTLLRQVFTPPQILTPKEIMEKAAKEMGVEDYSF